MGDLGRHEPLGPGRGQRHRAGVRGAAQGGGAITPGFYTTAKDILKSSASRPPRDFGYDSMIQGAGSVEAGKATATASGGRATVSPNEWRVGDYRRQEFPVFAHTIAPGGSAAHRYRQQLVAVGEAMAAPTAAGSQGEVGVLGR